MSLLLALAAFVLAAAAYLVAEVVTQPAREHLRSIQRAATYGRLRQSGPGLERLHFRARVLDPAVQSIARIVLRVNPRMTTEVIAGRLLAAGMSGTITPTAVPRGEGSRRRRRPLPRLRARRRAWAAPALRFPSDSSSPGWGSSRRASLSRFARAGGARQIRAQLPDALDLLAVSVEAGLGFDGAVVKLTEHMEGPLADEFSLTLGEMRIGESRHDALKKLAIRAGSPEVSSFCRAIIQADQLGISLGRILRVQAVDSRLKRQDAAEERAMKSPIKMLFPTVIFIFPAMFIVILGPAFLQLSKLFEL